MAFERSKSGRLFDIVKSAWGKNLSPSPSTTRSTDDAPTASPLPERFRETYLLMAKEARYRPMAPSDGLGRIELTKKQLADPDRLEQEATAYALAFSREEDEPKFRVGCSIFETNRAPVWTIEAARLLAGGGNTRALALLKMAAKEVEKAGRGIAEIL